MIKRRHFLSTSIAASGLVSACKGENNQTAAVAESVYQPPEDELVRISILHTTDLHGHVRPTKTYGGVEDVGGFGRCMSQIREWRKRSDNHLTLDIGDLYQGTHASLASDGEMMVNLLNAANFDAWVVGNHDLDWGENIFRQAVAKSSMPVLSNNLQVDGFATGDKHHQGGEFANLVPTIIKQVAGIKIGILGITTPGLPFWLNPGQLGSVQAIDPLVATKTAIANLKQQGADCIIAAGHMGLKRGDGDDYANQVNRILLGCPEIDVYLAGHTHRERPTTIIGNTVFTQAGYHGIWAGRVGLTFNKDKSQLIRRDAETVLMDGDIKVDPLALQIAGSVIDASDEELNSKVGVLADTIKEGRFDTTEADSQSLIAAGIFHVINNRGEKLDGVLHGSFSRDPIQAGEKSLRDLWDIIPYENRIVSASLTGEQLTAVVSEAYNQGYGKRLVGFQVKSKWDSERKKRQILSIKTADGKPIELQKTYRIGFNSYDAQSGGRKLLLLRELLLKKKSKTVYHPIDTRAALTDFFVDQKTVSAKSIAR